MPREAKPYLERGWYVSRPHGQYLRLCAQSDGMTEARRLLKLELGRLEEDREKMGGRLPAKLTVTEMFVYFLEDVLATKDKDTFHDYQRWCTEFAREHGNKPAATITKGHANDFKLRMMRTTYVRGKQPPKLYSPKTVNHALIAIRRAFNWAIDTDRLPTGRNPFTKVVLLRCEGRQRVATQEEYQTLLRHCTDDAFRDVLVAMRHTASRPQDIYTLTWPMVNWADKKWVIQKHKTSHTARTPKPRVIGVNDDIVNVLRRRREKHGEVGCVFLNEDGKPWTKNALGLRMRRLRKRAGIKPNEQGEEFVLYTCRHSFLTKAGADPRVSGSVLRGIAGHTNSATTDKYIHTDEADVAQAGRDVADGLSGRAPASVG